MSKSIFSTAVAVVVLACASVPASLCAAEVSPASAKAMVPVMEALKGKRWAEVLEKAEVALKIPEKTPYDTFVAYNAMVQAYQGQGNRAKMLEYLQKVLDTGVPQPAEQNQILRVMASPRNWATG
jgi:hypothetical protein